MNKLCLFLLIHIECIFSLPTYWQDSINIGNRHSLFSNILNEERSYWIYKPEQRPGESAQDYPVLYLLDGDVFFHSVVGFTRFFLPQEYLPCLPVLLLPS